MAVLTPNVVSSTIFCTRNVDKGNDGHPVRYVVAMGQAKKVLDNIKQLDNVVGQTANTATKAFGAVSKESIFLEGVGKTASFASKHINPLIIASAGLDILTSENKAETAVVSATSLGAMFACEKYMKAHLKDVPKMKCFEGIAKAVENATKGTKYGKYISPVLQGIAFVVGSCMAYDTGNKVGKTIVGKSDNKTNMS